MQRHDKDREPQPATDPNEQPPLPGYEQVGDPAKDPNKTDPNKTDPERRNEPGRTDR